jgi:multidrug efflux pump
MNGRGEFPAGAESYTIDEINFSEFPIIDRGAVGRSARAHADPHRQGPAGPDRRRCPVLEAPLAGDREEMVEVVIDPLRLESYNVTAGELINAVVNNNQLIAAGDVRPRPAPSAVKIPSSFDDAGDIYNLPVKVNGDRVVTLGDLADIRLTFKDRDGTARFNGETDGRAAGRQAQGVQHHRHRALVKPDGARGPRQLAARIADRAARRPRDDQSPRSATWSAARGLGADRGRAGDDRGAGRAWHALGPAGGLRDPDLVPFVLHPFWRVMGVAISNIVMFGLILAVGMLVDGAIVVVEYADKRIQPRASGRCSAYTEAAKRMFWPIVPRPRRRSAPSCRCCSGPACRANSWACCRSR